MARKDTVYRTATRCGLSNVYAVGFDGTGMETKDIGTVLTGKTIDQPHLYAVPDRVNGWGMKLLRVQALPEHAHPSAERKVILTP